MMEIRCNRSVDMAAHGTVSVMHDEVYVTESAQIMVDGAAQQWNVGM